LILVGQQASVSLLHEMFFNSFPLETDFFFCIFEQNPECTTGKNQMNSSNKVSVATLTEEIQSE